MTTHDNDSYEVGYGKPPRKSRFQKGHSGNPNGRPKKSKNLKTILSEELSQEITIQEQGQKRMITRQEALIKATMNQALNGDRTAQFKILDFIVKVMGVDAVEEGNMQMMTEDEKVILERYKQRILRNHSRENSEEGE